MARRASKAERSERRRKEAVVKLMGLGAFLVLLPMLLSKTPLGIGVRPLSGIGVLMLIAGAVLLFLMRDGAKHPPVSEVSEKPAVSPAPARPSVPLPLVERVSVPIAESTSATRTLTSKVRPTSWSPGVFSVIEWRRFEALVEALFAQAGFETKSLSHGADEGVDIWLYSKSQPGGEPVSVVQCKHWQGKRVGVDKIRELRGVMAARNVRRGQFATTSTFTAEAMEFGAKNGVNLLDVQGLLALIAKRSPEQQQALLDVALEGDYWRPTCVNCGVKMIDRTPRTGGNGFWGCVNFPRCRTTMPLKAV